MSSFLKVSVFLHDLMLKGNRFQTFGAPTENLFSRYFMCSVYKLSNSRVSLLCRVSTVNSRFFTSIVRYLGALPMSILWHCRAILKKILYWIGRMWHCLYKFENPSFLVCPVLPYMNLTDALIRRCIFYQLTFIDAIQ